MYATQQTSGGHLWPSITFATALSGYGLRTHTACAMLYLVTCNLKYIVANRELCYNQLRCEGQCLSELH